MKLKNYLIIAISSTIYKSGFFTNKLRQISFVNIIIFILALLPHTNAKAQNLTPFNIRYATELKGDMLVIGNNILGKDNNPLNDNTTNESVSMQYIDIDGDSSTFNSSSADLAVPNTVDCFRIAYAGLYWGALIKTGDSTTDINKIKFKTPGSSTYTDITGTTIYNNPSNPIDPDANKPYACYADITTIVSALTNPQGTYTVANVKSSIGYNGATGLAAGWTLYVIYEDPKTTTKYMVSYDGFSALYDGRTLDIDVGGFQTPPSGPINLKFGFATLNGDKSPNNSNKTKVEISNGTANGTALTTNLRPSNYFFNSSITNLDSYITSRNPNGTNSLGYDTGIEQLLNVNKSTVGNNATNVRFTLQVARGQANPLFSFFNAFQVNVIAPDISLTKLVKDISGNDIGNTDVALGTNLYYEIGFQNSGNDNVTNFTLKDVLPNNVIFNYPSDIISLPTGVTHTYNATTRQLIFTIPDNLVEVGDVSQTIRLHVQVVSNYRDLLDACANEIKNQAFASYRGVINTTPRVDEGSFASTVCNFGTPSSTNFLVNIDGQTFSSSEVLCGASVQLSGPDGYDTYSWSTSPTGTPVIGTNQNYNATDTGTYYITSTSPCATVTEAITVNPFGNTITNPIIPFADEVVVCPNNGKDLPNIFLCGANATRYIPTNISDASTIVWEQLDENSCAAITVPNCANESTSCQWNVVGTGPDYTANTSGQFRMTINYPGGCYSIFYFNVYQNILNPTATSRDIICNTNGEITIGGVPSGYEYSLDGTSYQASNVFSIPSAGAYTVYIRQVGVTTNPCIFTVENILIRQRNFSTSTIVTQPLCYGEKGAIKIAAQDAYPQYYYSIYQGTTLVNSVGPITASDYEFAGLNPGTYTVRVWTDDGCDYATDITIIEPPLLTATSALTKALTCEDGEITVYPTGGTPPYNYYVNGSTSSQTTPQITVSSPGTYSILVVDSQDCSTTTSIAVDVVPPPVYTIDQTNILCYGDNSGQINFNVTNANGYSLMYSIDNGVTYTNNPTFSNLSAGTYNAIVKYTLAGTDCFSTAQTITITQPAAALTATASITELAGCGPSGEGKISITNPQGGTAPYEYSFDNQVTWTIVNEAYKAPGTYTVYIRDANACVYAMSNVTIAPPPVTPTIAMDQPVFNCDGTVSSNITVTTAPNADYTYQYLIDGVVNTNSPANIFTNLSSGSHTISVKYISTTAATACIPQTDFTVIIPTGKLFTATIATIQNLSCSGANDGQITIAATNFDTTNGYQYSLDNGTTWNTQTISPYTITGLAMGTYSIQIRYDAAATGTCVQSFTQILTAPAPLVTTASITSLASCTAGATITASSTGGTTAYRYELWDATGTTNIMPSQNTGIFTNVAPGTYIVRGYDANNCTDDTAVLTVVTPPTLTATLDPSSDVCFDSVNQASLQVNVSGGTSPFVYSLDGAPAQSSNTFNNVSPGTHEIVVTDSYNCTATIANITIAPQLTATIPSVKELDCTSTPNAVINGTISGGYAPYTVTLISGTGTGTIAQPGATTFTYTTAIAGTYQFQIQDAKGCTTTTSATINPLVPVNATLNTVNPLCNGDANGSVQIIPSGGVGPYTYSFQGSAFTTTSLYSGLSANIAYAYEVRDSKNCPFTGTITLTEPTALTTTATVIPFSCSTTNTKQSATITIEIPTTGTASYTYSFNGGGYSNSRVLIVNDNGTNQSIPYSVRDGNGCVFNGNVDLNKLNPPVAGTIGTTAVTCNITTSTVTVTPSTGTGVGPLTYEIISPVAAVPSNTTGVFTGLLPGTYIFKVTDANGCYYTQSHYVLPVIPIAVAGNVTSDVLCKGGNTGSAAFMVSGYSGTYTSSLTNGTGTLVQSGNMVNLTNLIAGSYTVQVTDNATGCTASTSVTITEPTDALSATFTTVNANCFKATSQVTVTPTGGTPNYTYSFVVDGAAAGTYGTSNTANLDPNLVWDVWVKDANGCTFKLDLTIAKDPTPTVTASATGQCFGVGSYTITATPGSGLITPLSYSINNGASYQTGNTFIIGTPGNYTVTIKDGNGCTADSAPLVVAPQLTLSAVLNKDITCNPAPTAAQITITATGGTAPFTYESKEASGSYTAMASNVFNSDIAGSYTFRVTDAKGCSAVTTTPIVLTAPENPEITSIDQTQEIYCNGEATASIKVNIDSSKGVAPFTYSIDGTNFQVSNVFSSLAAGTYTVTVKDSKGCTDTQDITIDQPDAINYTLSKTDILCASMTLGSITVNTGSGLGGTAPYTYILTNNAGEPTQTIANPSGTNYTFSNLNFGTYYLTVVDANGCSLKITAKIASPPDNLDIVVQSTADCASGGTVKVTATGVLLSSGPFYFAIYQKDPITGLYPMAPTFSPGVQPPFQAEDTSGSRSTTFTGLLQGVIYSFIVYDQSTGCSYIKEASTPTIKATSLATLRVVTDVTCKGSADGTVSITLDKDPSAPVGYVPPTSVDYVVYNSQTNLPISPTNDGYGISVGTYPFTMPLIGGLSPGSYYVVITEHGGTNNGCMSATLPFDIYESATDLEVTATVVKNDNCNLDAGQIVAIAKGGTTASREDSLASPPQVSVPVPYQYQILQDNGTIGDASDDTPPSASDANWNTINTFMKESGNYIVYAMDANKCIKSFPITLDSDIAPTITLPAPICYDGNPFTITITGTVDPAIVGGKTYSVNGSAFQTSPSFTFNAAGTYNLVIKDGNGCTADVDYIVYPQLQMDAALTKELDCTASPNAEITLTVSGGNTNPTPNYTYEYSTDGGTNWTTLASNVYSAVAAGTFDFRVTDANNLTSCQTTTTLTLDPIPGIVFTTTQTNVSCNAGNDGSITVNVTSGVGPYEYKLDGPVSYPYQSSNQFNSLTVGTTYIVTVRDSKMCEYTSSPITITQPTPLSATSLITTPLSCGAGNTSQPATVTVTGASGTAPYTYSFNGGVNYTSNNIYQSYTGTTFDVWVKDANGCTYKLINGVDIPPLNPPTDMDITGTPVYCAPVANQTSTVSITNVQNGTGTLSYAILFPSSATSNVSGATSGVFTGLAPDTYLFQVTDTNGCTYQESYSVNPVTNITVSGQLISDVTCNPGSNGEVRFTVANFAGNYTYSINGGAVSAPQSNPTITVSGLSAASTQTINITDVITGCTATASVVVAQPAPLALVANPFINANCNFGAQVTVTASGGIPPYSYSYVISGSPAGTYSTSASAVLDPAVATAWDVYVKDANGCVITTPLAITIATDPLPTVTVNPYSQCPSGTGTYTFTVNVASGMAPFEYSIGAGFQASPTFTLNAAGTYDVTVKDKNGCTTTASGLISISPALQLSAAITALPSCIDGDGALTLTATGGSGTYEYSIDSGIYQPSANFAAIAAGSHTVTVRDITTTCTKAIPVNLGSATPITGFALSKTNVSCNGGSNGVITATMATPAPGVNDNPVYRYSLSGDVTRAPQTSNIFSGLPAGNYTVTVTSARGCVATENISITEPAIITVPAPTVSPFGCNAGTNAMNFATITVTGVTGGSGVYSYEFIKGGTRVQFGTNHVYTEANLLGGTYTVNVYDNKGCVGTAPATITIVPFIALDKINITVNNAITCTNLEDITVSVSSIGGTPTNLQYTVVDYNATTGVSGALYPSQTNATGVFTGLPVANYLITVTNLDTGCSVKSVHYVSEPNTFDLIINGVTDVTCYGGTNGSANVTLIDRVITATNPNQAGPFSYTVVDTLGNPVTSGTSATAGPLTINVLAAGTYIISATLTNSPFCTVSKNFTVNQPNAALTIAETHTAITCISGNNDGSISATATGGWPGGYMFELIGPKSVAYSAQRTFTNLTAGPYTVNVKDSKGCVATTTVTLVIPTPIAVTASPNTTMLSCFGDKNATITVNTTTGGQGSNYMYTLNTTSLVPATASGPQASPVFSGLGAGTYTITVTDGYSCSATSAPIVIAQPTRISASLVVAATQTCLTQTRLTLSATGGTGTYTYSADAAFTTVLGSFATSTTFPVPAGTYVYYVKDANGCVGVVSNQIKIDPLPALIINLDKTNAVVNCAGDNTGVIVATAQGGLGNYSYTLLNGSGAIIQGPTASGNFTGLFAGNYQVKVDSGDCTTQSAIITITQPLAPLTATYVTKEVTCNGSNNGIFTVSASGGTGIIKYAISPNLNQFFDTNVFDNLAPGNYNVIVQDALGCYVKINFDITEPAPVRASTIAGTVIPEVCFGDKDGAFSIDITGGVLPYKVSLDNPNGTYTTGTSTQTIFDFTGLVGGTHTVYIRDANACSFEWEVILPQSVKINPVAVVDYSCVNNSASNSVTVRVDASITNPADLNYSLDGAPYQTSNIFINVIPGTNHYIDVKHTNGCIQRTANFNILQVDPLALTISDGGLNEIVATATGGGGGYQYTFNGESTGTKNTFIIYKSGDYTVEVTDVNGCVASATRYFEYIDVCIPNYFTPNGDGISDGWAPGCTINYKNLTFDIFDRYGRKIATYHLGQQWDGKYNGQELPSGDYWFVVKLNDPKDNREFVGHFTLYR